MGYKVNNVVFYGFQIEKYGIFLDFGFFFRESILFYDVMVYVWLEWLRMQVCVYIYIYFMIDSFSFLVVVVY